MYDAMFQERRLTRRAPVRSTAQLLEGTCGGEEHRVLNLSVGGAFLSGRCPHPQGSALRVSLALPNETLRLCAHVVRIQRAGREAFAIGWDWLTPAEEDAIASAVNAALRRERPRLEGVLVSASAEKVLVPS